MRWEKGEDYVEIEGAISTGGQGAVWNVKTNLDFKDLPIEFRPIIPKADEEGFENLKRVISSWAERNGFQLVPADDA